VVPADGEKVEAECIRTVAALETQIKLPEHSTLTERTVRLAPLSTWIISPPPLLISSNEDGSFIDKNFNFNGFKWHIYDAL
jgi:hypothetical protein